MSNHQQHKKFWYMLEQSCEIVLIAIKWLNLKQPVSCCETQTVHIGSNRSMKEM
jgi:hypothetical protein